jgi:signal transduction histidine kinase
MKKAKAFYPQILFSLGWLLVLLLLYLTSLYSYLLFHSLVEFFSIIVACGIFMLAWNSRRFLDNNYLLLIGIAYLFVALLDLLHTLAYKGMGVFPNDANLATQLWIAARYLQSISLLIAPLFLNRTLRPRYVFFGYSMVIILLLLSIFYWPVFPNSYIEGVGLTPFKRVSEYVISLILGGAIVLLFRYRDEFDGEVLRLLIGAIVLTIGAELAFTVYVGVYDLPNLIGHIFKLISFYLIYKAIIETGLVKPYSLLFRRLKQSEETLRQYTIELQTRNEDLDAFAHTVAHDLKTPISNIVICCSLFEEHDTDCLDEEQQELITTVQDTAYKMSSIINELLLLAEVRKGDVHVEPLNMARIVAEVRQRLSPLIEEYEAQILLPHNWPIAVGYGPWIEAVWTNYITNALKYGGRPPKIELGADIQPDNQYRFWVRDNGRGLALDQQTQLFASFTQLKQIRIKSGHGLGLSIVKRIVDKLNGQVGVESENIPGRGSTFYFTLPASD